MKRGPLFVSVCCIALIIGWWAVQALRSYKQQPLLSVSHESDVLAVVVPHHDLVKEKRRELLKQMALRSQPDTIVLLSPNHFYDGSVSIVTTDYTWKLQGGEDFLLPDTFLIQHILEYQGVTKDTSMVRGDHGITNLVGDIHEFFPKSRMVPILLSDAIPSIEVKRLEEALTKVCGGRCGVIASVDMSHYQSAGAASVHDIKTIRTLELLESDSVWEVEVDSRASLVFLMEWARHFSLSNFTLAFHTNSGELSENFESETTSHIAGYYASESMKTSSSAITFTIAGSVSGCQTDRNTSLKLSDFGTRALWGTDLAWVFWSDASKNSDLRNQLVKKWNWTEASSSSDGGLEAKGILTRRANVGNQRIVFLSAGAENAFVDSAIRSEKEHGWFVAFLPRWKGQYGVLPTGEQHEKARLWIRAGAGLIAGFHEKGIQTMEMIDEVPVFYSVGGLLDECGEANGLIINGSVEDGEMNFSFDPVQSKNLEINLLSGLEREQIL